MEELNNCQVAFEDGNDLLERVAVLTRKVGSLEMELRTTKEESRARSNLFAFWVDYINMVQLLSQFVRAERRGDWLLHLSATAAMTP